jgi:hypothetical protein
MEGSLSQRERAGVREIANLPDGLTLFPRPPDFCPQVHRSPAPKIVAVDNEQPLTIIIAP